MTQSNPENNVLENYIQACGYGYCLPGQPLRPPVKKTENIVQDYINAAGFGLRKL